MGGSSSVSRQTIWNEVINVAVLESIMKATNSSRSTASGVNRITLKCDQRPADIARLPVCMNPQTGAACKAIVDAQVEMCTLRDSEISQISTFDMNLNQEVFNDVVADVHGRIENEIENTLDQKSDSLGQTLRSLIPAGKESNIQDVTNKLVTELRNTINVEFMSELQSNVNALNEFNAENYRLEGVTITQSQAINVISQQLSENIKIVEVANEAANVVSTDASQEEVGVFGLLQGILDFFSNPWFLIIVAGIIIVFLIFKFGGTGGQNTSTENNSTPPNPPPQGPVIVTGQPMATAPQPL